MGTVLFFYHYFFFFKYFQVKNFSQIMMIIYLITGFLSSRQLYTTMAGSTKRNLQPSKKGKRAWRKNIDLDDIEAKIDERRQEEIDEGKPVEEMKEGELFYIDEDEDEHISKKLRANNIKPLKAAQILAEDRSKIPKIVNQRAASHRKKLDGVTGKQIHRLMKLAGRVQGVTKTEARVEKEGIVNGGTYDLWGEPPAGRKKARKVPELLEKYSGSSYTPAKVIPKTMKMKPVKVRVMEKVPVGGKSYNPSFESWRALINQEYFKEKSKEDQKEYLRKQQEKIQYMVDHFDDNEVAEEEDEEDKNDEKDKDYKLSVNPPTKLKIKTKAKRNREKREKERQGLIDEIKSLKDTINQIEKLPEILAKEQKRETQAEERHQKRAEKRKNDTVTKLGSRYQIGELPMEVKLSDELDDSLRKLRPEGDLVKEQMMRFEASGKMVVRKKVKAKKAKKKVTEKWSYKDFKA